MKLKKTGFILALPIFFALASMVQASGKTDSDKTIEELKQYIDENNLSVKSEDSEYLVQESKYKELLEQKSETQKKTILLQNQIDRLDYLKGQHSDKRNQINLSEKHQLQKEYYNICLLINELDIAQNELKMLEKKENETKEKLKQGDVTQLEVDESTSKRKQAETKVDSIKYSVDNEKNNFKMHLNKKTGEKSSPKFSIPAKVVDKFNYSLEALKKNCCDKNLQLLQLNAYVKYHDKLIENLKSNFGQDDTSYQVAFSERSKMQVDADILKQKIYQYIEKQYNNFKSCKINYDFNVSRRPILIRKLENLRIKYEEGIVSEADYLLSQNQILKELAELDSAIVELINANSVMNLIDNGIVQ